MSLTIAVTAGKTLARNEVANNAKLNALGLPTLALSGTASTAQIGDDQVTAAKAAFGAWFLCTASTAANVITLTASGHSVTLATGMIARFVADATTTGAVDITFGGGTKNLFRNYNVELGGGDLKAGQAVEIFYDGTQWQLLSVEANRQVVIGTDAGGTDAYAITPTPSVRALADLTGVPVIFKANTINTGAATLAVSGLAATTIVKSKDVTLDTGDIKAGQWVTVTYDGANFQLLSPVTPPSARTTVSVRQTVVGCSVDASTGLPNFLATGATTTAVYLQNCSTTPLVVTFAYGHDDSGAVDYVTRISTAGATWTGLGGTTTYYLYVDRNVSTGAITYGITTNRPTYVNTSTVVAGAGFHTYLINTGFMYEGSATTTPVQRVFVGEATTSAGAVATVTAYMPRGQYVSAETTFPQTTAVNDKVTFTHQIGLVPQWVKAVMRCKTSQFNYAVGDELDGTSLLTATSALYGWIAPVSSATTVTVLLPWANVTTVPQVSDKNSPFSAGNLITVGNWKLVVYANRGW